MQYIEVLIWLSQVWLY